MGSKVKQTFQVEKLNKSYLNEHIDQFLLIDKNLSETLVKWDFTNFLFELPEKWQLSFYAHSGETILGYMICSKKEFSTHIHRLAVCKEFQGIHLGSSLIEALEDYINSNIKITLKVKKFNFAAIKFYEKNGFIRSGEEDYNYLYEKNCW